MEPDVANHLEEPQSDLWTSDSERGIESSEALPSGAVDPTAPDKPAGEPAAVAAGDATERDETGRFKGKKGKPRTDPQARVEAATAKEAAAKEEARQATARAEALEARLARLEQARTMPAPAIQSSVATTAGPDFPDFEHWSEQTKNTDWHAYMRAAARFEAEQALAQYQHRQTYQTRLEQYNARMAAAAQKYPDFEQVKQTQGPLVDAALAKRGLTQFPLVMHYAVSQSEMAGDIIRDLGLHPEDAAQLAVEVKDLPVSAATVVQRLLESRLASSAAARPDSASGVRPSAARPPVNRVGGTANAQPVDPEELEFGPEYIRLENAREKKRQEAGRW